MPAKIIKHAEFEDTYDDPDHPIPSLTVVDVHAVKKDGGGDLAIIVASPLMADEYSQTRLLDKIEGYLGFISSKENEKKSGPATPENTRIVVHIHSESDPAIFDLLERSKPWVLQNNVSLEVKLSAD
ncbi:MAG: hypothetical protein KAR37_11425 [Alphaproteobacteria bacterium]|nr:hypothetical protein [Alphaproteobacteria bacterium]